MQTNVDKLGTTLYTYSNLKVTLIYMLDGCDPVAYHQPPSWCEVVQVAGQWTQVLSWINGTTCIN